MPRWSRGEWLDLARHGLDFLRKYGFDSDGRMFFTVARDGRPLRKRRYPSSESFAVMALAAYAKAADDRQAGEAGLDLFRMMIRYHTTPGLLPPKIMPETRQPKGVVMPMILIATAQILRDAIGDPICDEWIERSVDEIESRLHEAGVPGSAGAVGSTANSSTASTAACSIPATRSSAAGSSYTRPSDAATKE